MIEIVDSTETARRIAERLAPVSRLSMTELYAALVEHLDDDLADDAGPVTLDEAL